MAMQNDDEEPRLRPKLAIPPLEPLGVQELEAYILELRGEIARAQVQIARKKDHRSAADSVFKLP